MNCPRDNKELLELEHKGVTVDKCEQCGGIWLDKGELQKIVDRAKPKPEVKEVTKEVHHHHNGDGGDFIVGMALGGLLF